MDPILIAQASSLMPLPRFNGEFYFGLFALIFSVIVGAYYALDWFRYHRRVPGHVTILWALGSFLSFWFQIPFLIANAGISVVVAQYHLLFSIMTPVAFFGVVMIYRGIRTLSNPGGSKLDIGLAAWCMACVVYFGFFFYNINKIDSYAPLVFGATIFFMAIFAESLLSLVRWYKQLDLHQQPRTAIGVVLLCSAVLLQLATCTAALLSILVLPPQMWFMALMFSAMPFALQSVSVIALSWAFYYIHREQMPHTNAF